MASQSQRLTEYERKRLENIKRNDEMMDALKIRSKADTLSATVKRQSVKTYKVSPLKKPKTETPVVIRRSLRTRGMPPGSKGLADDFSDNLNKTPKSVSPLKPKPPLVLGPVSMNDAFSGDEMESNKVLIGTILTIAKENQGSASVQEEFNDVKDKKGKSRFCNRRVLNCQVDKVKEDNNEKFDVKPELVSSGLVKSVVKNDFMDGSIEIEKNDPRLESLDLKPENVARLLPERIMVVKFFPCSRRRMIAAGNKDGNIAFWNVDVEDENNGGIYLYSPHTGPISEILVQQHSMSKILTSSYDGFLRLMDTEKEIFVLVHYCYDSIFSLSQQPDNLTSLYVGEGLGRLNIWDIRAGKSCNNWILHEDRINTIDFNSQNPNIMATSSTDGTACIWDIRGVVKHKPKPLKTVTHDRAVHAAYFSPSGRSLATTSLDNKIGILNGVNYEDISMMHHYNQTGKWVSPFSRAIWGWDDSYIFLGNMKRRGVDVISPAQRRIIMTLRSPNMSAIPCRFHSHPYEVGTLAAATGGGKVYIWTTRYKY